MVNVWLEHLCEHCILVRVGASGPFPAPYKYSVTFVIRDGYAEPVGLDHKHVTVEEFETAAREINKITGKLLAYDRAGPPSTRVVQKDPRLTKGRIVMSKHSHHVKDAFNKDGSVDTDALKAGVAHWMAEIESGKYSIVSGHEIEVDWNNDVLVFVRKKN